MNAPEQCPVCGANWKWQSAGRRLYECGAGWYFGSKWETPCPHAMTACLRTGATLTATPLEQAEKALVAAAVNYDKAWHEWWNSEGPDTDEKLKNAKFAANDAVLAAVAAYRTALDGAK